MASETQSVDLRMPEEAPVSMYVNRFSMKTIDGHKFVRFAFLDDENRVQCQYSCMIAPEFLKQIKDSWIDYLGMVGTPPSDADISWKPYAESENVDVVRFAKLARADQNAEISLFTFSIHDMLHARNQEATKGKPQIPARALMMLACPLDLQLHFIVGLYLDDIDFAVEYRKA